MCSQSPHTLEGTSRFIPIVSSVLFAAAAALGASTAYARPVEAGAWDPRFDQPVLVMDRPTGAGGSFDWWTASFSERKRFLETKYAVPARVAAIAATGGMPLSRIDGEGRGAFVTPKSLGASVLVRF